MSRVVLLLASASQVSGAAVVAVARQAIHTVRAQVGGCGKVGKAACAPGRGHQDVAQLLEVKIS